MHLVVEGDREEIFRVLIEHDNLRLELQDKSGFPPLWYALASSTDFSDSSYASMLIKKGASPDAVSGLPTSLLSFSHHCLLLIHLLVSADLISLSHASVVPCLVLIVHKRDVRVLRQESNKYRQ